MSQAGLNNTSSGPVPPTVATSYVTDVNSPAIPAANVLNVIGGETTANNLLGIQTDGSSGSNTLTVQLTNRATGAIGTNDDSTVTIITFPLGATPATYTFDGFISGLNTTTPSGGSYFFVAGARTDGATATSIGVEFTSEFEEAAFAAADVDVTVSGNNLIVQVTGIAANNIDWLSQFTYSQVE